MPAEDRVGREQRADLLQSFATKHPALHCQSAALVIREQNPSLTELLFQHSVFGQQVIDQLLLLSIHPASQDDEAEMPWFKDEVHRIGSLGDRARFRSSGWRASGPAAIMLLASVQ